MIDLGYDSNGNLTSLTPPGRPPHTFTYTEIDLPESTTAPDVGTGPAVTMVDWNEDRQLDRIDRPGGTYLDYQYDETTGRLTTLSTQRGDYGYQYHPESGLLTTVTDPDGGSLAFSYDGSLPRTVTWTGEVSGSFEQIWNNDLRVDET